MIISRKAIRLKEDQVLHLVPVGDVHYNCVSPEHFVLTSEFNWRQIGNINPGTQLLALEEFPDIGKNQSRHFIMSEVEHSHIEEKDAMEISLSSGEKIITTPNHPWLARWHGLEWIPSLKLTPNTLVRQPLQLWEKKNDFWSGWLSGFFDGEGTLTFDKSKNILIVQASQRPGSVLDKSIEILTNDNFKVGIYDHPSGVKVVRVEGGWSETVRFLGSYRPIRLLEKFDPRMLATRRGNNPVYVTNTRSIGKQPIAVMGTSSGTYFANGYAMHNTKECDREKFHGLIEWANKVEKKGDRVLFIGLGDYNDALSPSERAGVVSMKGGYGPHEGTLDSINEWAMQITETFYNAIESQAHNWWGLLEGHHYMMFTSEAGPGLRGRTTTEILAHKLGCKYFGTMLLGDITFPGTNLRLRVMAAHGYGGARTVGARLIKRVRMAEVAQAQIYIMGHDNEKLAKSLQILKLDDEGRLDCDKQYFLGSGSFQKAYEVTRGRGGYVEQLLLPPSDLGVSMVDIRIEKRKGRWRLDYHASV